VRVTKRQIMPRTNGSLDIRPEHSKRVHVNKCLAVPRSRSRMSAAPVSRTEIIVIWSISATTVPNERRVRFGF
jgi:hypothetical protein